MNWLDAEPAPAAMTEQARLDLAQFQAQAAQLGLLVAATKEFELAIDAQARQVTGAVQPFAGHEGVVDETLGGQLR